jgi:polar amino acid transport system permease protein
MTYNWDFSFLLVNWQLLATGLGRTLTLAATCLVTGLIIGIIFGVMRIQKNKVLRTVATCYVGFFRNIPPLVQLFWLFYLLPILLGVQSDRFGAAVVSFSLYSGAYFAEIIRSGIQSIDRGQWEAARAIGMNYPKAMRYVVLPQAIKRLIPPLTNQAIDVVKLTTIASSLAYAELLYQAKLLSEVEFRPLEAYTAVGGMFIGMLLILSYLSSRLERRLAKSN